MRGVITDYVEQVEQEAQVKEVTTRDAKIHATNNHEADNSGALPKELPERTPADEHEESSGGVFTTAPQANGAARLASNKELITGSRAVNVHDARRAVWRPLLELPRQYDLIRTLARRELVVRYRASTLGFLWAFMTPLVMLALYTFVFGVILGVRFGKSGTAGEYALYLFCGLLPWTAFAESLQTSSTVVIQHANLVKRVVFPLETLPAAQVSAAIVNQLVGTLALVLAIAIVQRQFHATMLWLPVLLVPQIILTLGAAWFIASFGVFVRDTAQVIGLLLTVWMYLTPIIYPEQIVPAHFKRWLDFNPFTALVRNYRRVLLDGVAPDFYSLFYFTLFALVVFMLGYYWFAKTRKNFADVL